MTKALCRTAQGFLRYFPLPYSNNPACPGTVSYTHLFSRRNGGKILCLADSPTPVVYYYIELVGTLPGGTRMVQLPQENSIFTRTVRRAAGEDRLSHAVILTGRGDLTAARCV